MTLGPAYPHPIGARVALIDCHGGNRLEGEVTGTPGPWTIRVATGRAVYLAAVGLVVERLDAASETFAASREVEKISSAPAQDCADHQPKDHRDHANHSLRVHARTPDNSGARRDISVVRRDIWRPRRDIFEPERDNSIRTRVTVICATRKTSRCLSSEMVGFRPFRCDEVISQDFWLCPCMSYGIL